MLPAGCATEGAHGERGGCPKSESSSTAERYYAYTHLTSLQLNRQLIQNELLRQVDIKSLSRLRRNNSGQYTQNQHLKFLDNRYILIMKCTQIEHLMQVLLLGRLNTETINPCNFFIRLSRQCVFLVRGILSILKMYKFDKPNKFSPLLSACSVGFGYTYLWLPWTCYRGARSCVQPPEADSNGHRERPRRPTPEEGEESEASIADYIIQEPTGNATASSADSCSSPRCSQHAILHIL
jgi:hypothetical protein